MPKGKRALIEVKCPCCDSVLRIDPDLQAVIGHEQPKKPPVIEDMSEAVQRLKGEEARRSEAFDKSFQEHKKHQEVLERKFDQLFKQAKESPDTPPPKRPFDFD